MKEKNINLDAMSAKLLDLHIILQKMETALLNEKLDIATKIAHITKGIHQASQKREELFLLIPTQHFSKSVRKN